MALKRNNLLFCIFAWTLFSGASTAAKSYQETHGKLGQDARNHSRGTFQENVIISEEQSSSGDTSHPISLQDQNVISENISLTPVANVRITTTDSPMNITTSKLSTLISMLTSSTENPTTDQSSTVKDYVTKSTKELRPTTLLAVTKSTKESSTATSLAETTTLLAETTTEHLTGLPPVSEKHDKKDIELLIRLNGYKIATFCLAAVLAIVLLIILIYFSAKSKTGHGEITCPPGTPPPDVEDYQKDEEPRVVRLSSYFPYAVDTLPKDDINENGIVDDRRVTTFLTKKNKPQEDATGSQDKILHTSEL